MAIYQTRQNLPQYPIYIYILHFIFSITFENIWIFFKVLKTRRFSCKYGYFGVALNFYFKEIHINHMVCFPQGVLLGLSNTAGVLAGVIGTAATGYTLQHGMFQYNICIKASIRRHFFIFLILSHILRIMV